MSRNTNLNKDSQTKNSQKKSRKATGMKAMAGAMAVVIAAGLAANCGYQRSVITAKAAEVDTEELQEVAENALDTEGGATESADAEKAQTTASKEESVYVKADPAGNAKTTTVTEWLKNPGTGTLADISELEDIKNIKGEETYTESGESGLDWQAEGDDIYYQGTTEKELPVGVQISYKLDGKEISAEDLQGKDGKVEIHIQYTNDSKSAVDVDGNSEEMFTPFTMITAMMLPADEYQNVEIDNGKVISDAEKEIVIGLGFPGLTENLKLENEDFELPEDVTITADVKNASVGPTITVASTEFLQDLDLDDIDDFSDLSDSIDELKDATNQLVDGSKEAADGAKQLADGAGTLADGAGTLADGVNTLDNSSGVLISGVQSLSDGINSYTEGIKKLADGMNEFGMVAGAESLANGAAGVSGGVVAVSGVIDQLKAASAQAVAGAGSLYQSLGTEGQLAASINAITATADGTASVSCNDTEALKAYLTQLGVTNVTDDMIATIQSYFKADTSNVSVQGKDTALYVLSQVQEGAVGLQTATTGIDNGLGTLQQNMTGDSGLVAGSAAVAQGAASLKDGVSTVKAGVEELQSYNSTLTGGAAQLLEGGAQLANGVGQLADGANALDSGAGTLADGADALAEGNQALADGMSEYKTEAIDKLTDLFDGDIAGAVDRLKAMTELGKDYQSFAGISSNMSGTTKFIIETEGVEE